MADGKTRPPSGSSLGAAEMEELGNDIVSTLDQAAEALGGVVEGATKEVAYMSYEEEGPEVDEADKKEYIRTLLAGEPFGKTYPLYAGKVEVAFRTRTVKENDAIYACQHPPKEREKSQLLVSLLSVLVGGAPRECDESMDELLYAAIRESFREFEKLCDVMFTKANNPDFWMPTDGDS